ncbi:MAG: hypothetical protein QXP49_05580 [Nitrososphaerota archaeon]
MNKCQAGHDGYCIALSTVLIIYLCGYGVEVWPLIVKYMPEPPTRMSLRFNGRGFECHRCSPLEYVLEFDKVWLCY